MNASAPAVIEPSRGSLESWLNAAYESLKDAGVDAVRIQPLAKKLKLSRTSFSWFFEDRDALLQALIDQWKSKNTGNLVARTEAYAESITEAILNVFDCWLDARLFDSQFEFAMRSWALQSAEVAQDIAEADALRIAALKAMFDRFGFADRAAETRARSIYLTQIGYISMKTVEPLEYRLKFIPEYLKIFTGLEPEPRELERFFSRHQLVRPAG